MLKNKKGYIISFRKSRTFKGLSVYLILNFLFEIIQPNVSLALTEGPSRPEGQSFEPIGTTQMVDAFSGDFNYNIPLFNLPGPNGGYPVNLAYHAGTTIDDESTAVGLGWNINVGSLTRSMRGLPDEFNSTDDGDGNATETGDFLEIKSDIKPSWTVGARGSMSFEALGADGDKLGVDLSLNFSEYYNNYNGIGVTLGAGISSHNSPLTYGVSLDKDNGLGVSADYSMNTSSIKKNSSYKQGFKFDGSLSIDYSLSKTKIETVKENKSFGSGLSFATNNYIPSIANKMNSYSLSLGIRGGVEGGVFRYGSVSLFYDTQDINDADKKGRKHLVVGYSKIGKANNLDPKYTRDFSRANDGQITKDTKFLPRSHFTYDTYNSTGQGLSGFFRPRRSDVGRSFDPEITNHNYGLSGSVELGEGAIAKTGVDGSGIFGYSSQGAWNTNNDLKLEFQDPSTNGRSENVYYQAHGETTILDIHEMDHINGFELPFIRLSEKVSDGLGGGKRKVGTDIHSVPNESYVSGKRKPNDRVVRNTLIHTFENKDVLNLGEFNVKYFDDYTKIVNSTPTVNLDRSTRNCSDGERQRIDISKHQAGFKVLNQEGSYYVYSLPTYNNLEIENLFSIKKPYKSQYKDGTIDYNLNSDNSEVDYHKINTQEFINKTRKSPYANSHLLTSVLGADYVDINNDGPDDSDRGYWVKFNYVKTTDFYKWRAPYCKSGQKIAQYNGGQVWDDEDDKASYQYGEKEVWYLAQMETKSHIAVFKMSPRKDMKEANGEHGEIASSSNTLKIDEIRIYEKKSFLKLKENAVALQVIHFGYDYSLCKGTPNAETGKLTLKNVWFTSNGSKRGAKNPYTFDYGNYTKENPSYTKNAYNSWGSYKPLVNDADYSDLTEFPYVNQFNQDWGGDIYEPAYGNDLADATNERITKADNDNLVSVWCLKKITLPSGGEINVNYESDDYGYVQHKTANQMFKIHKMGDGTVFEDNELYNHKIGVTYNSPGNRRIYFKLEKPILDSEIISKQVYIQYVAPIIQDENKERNLYFKAKMELTKNVNEYVSGYLPLEEYDDSDQFYGGLKKNSSDNFYTYGYVTIKKAVKKKKQDNSDEYFDHYHPMALAGWTHMQTEAQKLLHNPNSSYDDHNFDGPKDLMRKLTDMLNIIPSTASSFGLIRPYCQSKDFARFIDLNHSVIKLASPDKIKYGGGHRVKQISITDNWASATNSSDISRSYGQNYDYTTEEVVKNSDGSSEVKVISSGVAQYEPQAGGDENPLKYPIYYLAKASVFTKNNLFAEAPLNEELFPGPSVGYSKVTVTSINTKVQIDRKKIASSSNLPVGRTGGITVNEFYTAKDFPTLVDYSPLKEENSTLDVFNCPIPIPFIGSINRHNFHGTQAFKIETNNMHGVAKSVKTFELNDYQINSSPITSTFYEYQSDIITYQGETVYKLNNNVKVIINDGQHKIDGVDRIMGVEYDLFTDQRENITFHQDAGLDFNVDLPPFPIPFPDIWPSFNNTKSIMRTYVTNKVIHRTGILKKTTTKDVQSSNETEIVAYDEKSGQPLVSKIKNEFGDYFYSYNIPAYYEYDRMGHAYRNINYNFSTELINESSDHFHSGRLFKFYPNQSQIDNLVKGDELITGVMKNHNYSKKFLPVGSIINKVNTVDICKCIFTYETGCDNTIQSISINPANNNPADPSPSATPISPASCLVKKTVSFDDFCYYTYLPGENNTAGKYIVSKHPFSINDLKSPINTFNVQIINMIDQTRFNYNGQLCYNPSFTIQTEQVQVASQTEVIRAQTFDVEGEITIDNEKQYSKCYFLGWEYNNDGSIKNGLISFMKNLTDYDGTTKFSTDLTVVRSGRRNHYASMAANYLTKGNINSSNSGLTSELLRTNSDGSKVYTKQIPVNTVLSATASIYTDAWSSNFSEIKDNVDFDFRTQSIDRDINPFLSGNSGIFRPYKSYTYVGERFSTGGTSDNTLKNPNLRVDGVFKNPVKMFSWKIGNMEDYVSNWEWVNEVTRFSDDSYEIENINRLGIYSSALYGYDNSLTLAVGGNASYFELGTEDFETAPTVDENSVWKSDLRMKQNNLNFYKDPSSKNHVIISQTANIKNVDFTNGVLKFRLYNPPKRQVDFLTNYIFSGNSFYESKSTLGITLSTEESLGIKGNESFFLNGAIQSAVYNSNSKYIDVVIKPYLHCFNEQTQALQNGSKLYGKITMYEKRYMVNDTNLSGNVSVSSKKAHTGKKSIKIESSVIYDQPMLKMYKDKKYIASMWISRDKDKVSSIANVNDNLVVPGFMSGADFTPMAKGKNSNEYTVTLGKVIEGWQKVDLEFYSSAENPTIAFQFNPGSNNLYVDDIRFSPKTGGITTYVYDPVKFWLKASLNVDNYATFFFYDEEGNLTIKKQETENGIFTITESRGHIAEPKYDANIFQQQQQQAY